MCKTRKLFNSWQSATTTTIADFLEILWQQDYQVNVIVLGNLRVFRNTKTVDTYLVSLLPPSVPKSPIDGLHMTSLTTIFDETCTHATIPFFIIKVMAVDDAMCNPSMSNLFIYYYYYFFFFGGGSE